MAGRSPGLCLLLCTISCALFPAWCFHCQPTNCGCTNTSQGITVDLTAVDKMLTSRNLTVDAPNGGQYYLRLCAPLNLPDNCTNSLVCERNTLTNTYTSFGQKGAISYSVDHMPQYLLVVMTIGGGDALSGKVRRSTVVSLALIPDSNNMIKLVSANTTTLVRLALIPDSNNMIKLVSANTTTLVFSAVASSGHPLLFELDESGSTTDSPASGSSTTSSTTSNSTPSLASYASISTSPSITPSPRPTPQSSLPSISPSPQSSPQSFSPSIAPSLQSSHSPTSSTPLTLTSSASSSSNSTPPSSNPYFSSSPPTSISPSPQSPTFPPHCTDCSKNLALGLGVGIPITAILSSLATILLCFCCQRVVKRKRQYIRLAPTVYFDEEEHD